MTIKKKIAATSWATFPRNGASVLLLNLFHFRGSEGDRRNIIFILKQKRHTINNLIWSLTVNSFKNEQISISNNRNLL